jgi:hypothetical protein
METQDAVHALFGLADETRLNVFRHLVQTGPEGQAAGDIAERIRSARTHALIASVLNDATRITGSPSCGQAGRLPGELRSHESTVAFLMDNCCGGLSGHCEPAVAVAWVTDTATREPEIIGNE